MGNKIKTDYNLYVYRSTVDGYGHGFYAYIIKDNETKAVYQGYGNMGNVYKPIQVNLYGIIVGLYKIPYNSSVMVRTDMKTNVQRIDSTRKWSSQNTFGHYKQALANAMCYKEVYGLLVPATVSDIYTDRSLMLIDMAKHQLTDFYWPGYREKGFSQLSILQRMGTKYYG